MDSERIKQIQITTAYPESVSVMLALKQVWNECEQEKIKIVELEKLSAKIETCETILSSYSLTKSDKQSLRQVIKAEKKLREGIINELKLKP